MSKESDTSRGEEHIRLIKPSTPGQHEYKPLKVE